MADNSIPAIRDHLREAVLEALSFLQKQAARGDNEAPRYLNRRGFARRGDARRSHAPKFRSAASSSLRLQQIESRISLQRSSSRAKEFNHRSIELLGIL
jgi:hypothetical protein